MSSGFRETCSKGTEWEVKMALHLGTASSSPGRCSWAHPVRPGSGGSEMNGMRGFPLTSKLVLCLVAKGSNTSY